MVTLSGLVSDLDAELVRQGYKASTMVWYRGCWRRLERFFAARGVDEFSRDLALAWVDEACGFFDKEQAGTVKPTDVYLFRVAQMLGDGDDSAVFTAPGGRPTLRISPWTGGSGNVVSALIAEEDRVKLPGYRRVRIEALPTPPDAVWEYTYRDATADRLRGLTQ